jgi:adenosylmethionine-8-amino-7-oxononanoate aminotransferase
MKKNASETSSRYEIAATFRFANVGFATLSKIDGHTYSGNPLAAAVAIANLKVFRDERVVEPIQPLISQLKSGVDGTLRRPPPCCGHPTMGNDGRRRIDGRSGSTSAFPL